MTFGHPTPILRMFDEAATCAFWLDFLGFRVAFEHRFEPGMPLYLGIVRDGCTIHLSQHYGDATPGSAVRIPVDDVDAVLESLPPYGFARPGRAEAQAWGTREITIADPACNRITLFSPIVSARAPG